MNSAPLVIKVGGNELEKPGFVEQLAEAVAQIQRQQPCVVVHGGGRRVDELLGALGIQPQYVDGQRVTDEVTLEVVEMVLSGLVNKRLTRALLTAGLDALGVSGVDRALLRVEAWSPELGRVGRIIEVRADVLSNAMAQGIVPVLSPISMGDDGPYNVNADHAAGAVAAALGAAHVAFVTNVPGVYVNGTVQETLSREEVDQLIRQGTINGGMIPKVNAALEALNSGVQAAVITNLDGLCTSSGTRIAAS